MGKRRKARKPVKKIGSRQQVFDGVRTRTRNGLTKRSLVEFKGKVVSKASVVGTKAQVFRGTKLRTKGGLVKKDLMLNKIGRVVTKKMNKSGKKAYKGIQKWTMAVQKARKKLGITGWYSVKKGTPLYKEAKKIYGA